MTSPLPTPPNPEPTAQETPPAQPPAQTPGKLRHKLVIAYDGTLFHGWQIQKQPDGAPPIRTVAAVVQQTLARFYKEPIALVGSSRTDAGVHALGQVAHYDATPRIPVERVAKAINSRLPDDIDIRQASIAPPGFDAITSTTQKQYRYRVHNTSHRPLHTRHQVYHCWYPLDLALMQQAGRLIEGTHDYAGFTCVDHGRVTTVRTVLECRVETLGTEAHIVVIGTGFLYNMVRIIAGTLVDVGRGHKTLDDVKRALEAQDRRSAGETLPPQGLCLEWIQHQ
jgi:tRNA pseudouridine38-40 synthase